MSTVPNTPELPFDLTRDFSGLRRAAGHLAAGAFVGLILLMGVKIMAFTPAPDSDCLPEICGPSTR